MAFDPHADKDVDELMDMSGADEFEDDGDSTHLSTTDLIEDVEDANWDQLLDENDDNGGVGVDGDANNDDNDMQDEKNKIHSPLAKI